jgi:hypothetical protein
MEKKDMADWVEGYIQAWRSNDPADIGRLFSEGAVYLTGPFDEPWKGRQAIVQAWLGRKDAPGSYSFSYQVLAVDGRLGVVRGWTKYFQPEREYSNIWVIQLDDQGRCSEFTEWWMKRS